MTRAQRPGGSKTRYVYFDQNPYDDLLKLGITAERLSEAFRAHSLTLILTADNFQEWASCWKSRLPEKEAVGRRLLSFALAVRPRVFLAPADQLEIREIRALFRQSLPGPFLPIEDVAKAEELFRRFAEGRGTEDDRMTMLSRWDLKRESSSKVERLQAEGTPEVNGDARTLDEFIAANADSYDFVVRTYAERSLGMRLAGREIKLIRKKLDQCPALTAAVRTDCFITWRVVTKRVMRHDQWDDLRHCVNASYADLFITSDAGLWSAFEEIRPGAALLTTAELRAQLRLG